MTQRAFEAKQQREAEALAAVEREIEVADFATRLPKEMAEQLNSLRLERDIAREALDKANAEILDFTKAVALYVGQIDRLEGSLRRVTVDGAQRVADHKARIDQLEKGIDQARAILFRAL